MCARARARACVRACVCVCVRARVNEMAYADGPRTFKMLQNCIDESCKELNLATGTWSTEPSTMP